MERRIGCGCIDDLWLLRRDSDGDAAADDVHGNPQRHNGAVRDHGGGRIDTNADPDTDAYANTYADSDADAYADTYADTYADSHPDTDTDTCTGSRG